MIAYSEHLDRWLKRGNDGLPAVNGLQTEIERTQKLLLSLSQKRSQLRMRVDELRRELESLRAKHRR